MNTTILSSTLLLTLLLAVGLIFFIRASVKDRTQQVKLIAEQPEESLLSQLQEYFDERAYRVTALDAATNQVTFQGFVRPSWFLAIFLTLLAACGFLCLSLVLSLLYPTLGRISLALVLLAPAAGVFYWQRAGRTEQVSIKMEAVPNGEIGKRSLIAVTAHRDELAAMQEALQLKPCD
ncbi:MAG: cofactor assembly of complex C subunit B [Aphanothece sp. CMT-3BRIN-NPC111]|nr:cofactor assembly of complex C subunit B [Aphanothece sp. CMT-3BRIN-NPC111]